MKKTTKIVLMLLASLIALVSVFCITTFAAEAEDTLDVTIIKNIAVSDKIQAMYAVKADENITANNAKLTVYDETNNVVWSNYGVAENLTQFGGESYIVFYTNRVALAEIANFYSVQLEVDGVKSVPEIYSVAEYLFDKLYKDGFINKTETDGKDYNRKCFYEGLVQTGANAYEVLNNTAKRSIAALAYVCVDGATLADGSKSAVVGKGETVNLGSLPSGKSYKIISYTNGVAEETETKETSLVLDGFKVVTLISDLGNGKYYSDPSYSSGAKYSYDGMTKLTRNDLLTSDSAYNDITVENDAIRVVNRNFALRNGGAKTGTTYIFETDLFLEEVVATKTGDDIGWFAMSAGTGKKENAFSSFTIKYTADANGDITRVYITETNPSNVVCTDIEIGAWNNIRVEYTPNEDNTGTVKFYLNNELVKEYVSKGYDGKATNSNTMLECAVIQTRGSSSSGYSGVVRVDNTFISAIAED